jgi:subtilisin family serine protease
MIRLLLFMSLLAPAAIASSPDDSRIDPLLRVDVPRGLPGAPAMHDDLPVRAALNAPELTPIDRRRLEAAGLSFVPTSAGDPVEVGGQWLVEGSRSQLRAAALEGWSLQVGRPMDDRMAPTRLTGPLVGTDALAASGSSPITGLDGAGVAIFDIDSDVDPFHPHLFRADAGAFVWVDVDGDGELEPDVDGVDLDGDGEISGPEVLRLMEAWRGEWDYETYEWTEPGRDGSLDPDADFLWLDTDGDGVRDIGGLEGFTEDDPAYGEPIFIADDADGSGDMAPSERLLRLGTSRIRVAYGGDHAYRRGQDLVDYPVDPAGAGHGTGVLGLMGGGGARHASRYPGLLPEVDLLIFAWRTRVDVEMLQALAEAELEDVDVVLHEYAWWVRRPLDGSDSLSLGIDEQAATDIVHVCPTGNLGGTGKHAQAAPSAGAVEFALEVPTSTAAEPYSWLNIDLHRRSLWITECTLTDPNGAEVNYRWEGASLPLPSGHATWSADEWTGRGVRIFRMLAYDDAGEGTPLPSGRWTLRCPTTGTDTIHAYASDDVTGWSRGVTLENESDFPTMCWPSTSDSCIAVGASAGRIPYYDDSEVGELKDYSSRGPRMFGDRTVDVVAPTDAFAPAPHEPTSDLHLHPAEYRPFGGTSGAGPHVAAVAALMKQDDPQATGLEVRDRIRATAAVDSDVDVDGLPDDSWGYGKLRGYDATFEQAAPSPPNAPVVVDVDFDVEPAGDNCRVTASPFAQGHADATFRWDWSYDGGWDGDFEAEALEYVVPPGSELSIRLQAASGGWWIGGTVATWTVPQECELGGDACTGCSSSGSPAPPLVLLLLALVRRSRRGTL